jgi:hypothetical protein
VTAPAPLARLRALRGALAAAAQGVYDAWDQSGEDGDPELGFGGICQDVAAAMAEVLEADGIEAAAVSAACGEQHVFVVCKVAEGVFEVDIPPRVYERGGGYVWEKLPGVVFDADCVCLGLVDRDPEAFPRYASDEWDDEAALSPR